MKRIICFILFLLLIMPMIGLAESEEGTDVVEETVEADGEAEWSFPVALEDMEPQFVVLANKHYKLDKTFVPKPLVKMKERKANKDGSNKNGGVLFAKGGTYKLQEACAEALVAMSEGAREDGYKLYLKSAYRSWQTQNTMYSNRLKKNKGKDDGWVSQPGSPDRPGLRRGAPLLAGQGHEFQNGKRAGMHLDGGTLPGIRIYPALSGG